MVSAVAEPDTFRARTWLAERTQARRTNRISAKERWAVTVFGILVLRAERHCLTLDYEMKRSQGKS